VPVLAKQFLQRFARKHGVKVRGISDECFATLSAHRWPGNVRELQNIIERAVILCGDGGMLEPDHLGFSGRGSVSPAPAVGAGGASSDTSSSATAPAVAPPTTDNSGLLSLAEVEKRQIFAAMKETDDNRTHAAKLLGISVRTLRNKLTSYGVTSAEEETPEPAEAGSSPA